MKKFIAIIVLLLSPLAYACTYSTSFPGTETIISESGNWISGGAVGWADVRTTTNFAFGTQTGSGGFNDSTAIVSSKPCIWGPDQDVSAIVNVITPAAPGSGIFEEAEVRCRTTMSPSTITGYEILSSVITGGINGNYTQVVKWNGALGAFTQLNGYAAHVVTGDKLRATCVGNPTVIHTFITHLGVETDLGATTDTSGPSWLTGNPGVGFFLENASGLNANYGFSSFTATDNLPTQLWSGILAPSRATDWTNAGVLGGIPTTWTQCGSTLASTSTAAQINSAISSCAANHYVQLGVGTFTLNTGLLWANKHNVGLKGMGANQTFLIFTGADPCFGQTALVCFRSADVNYNGGPSNVANWTAGLSAGSTVLTLSSVANLAVGSPMALDQTNDTSDNGAILVCSSPSFFGSTGCVPVGQGDGGAPRPGRSQQQIVTVTAINGNNVTVTPAVRAPNWSASKTPQAWWATSPISMVGISNLSISPPANQYANITFLNCRDCWVQGIRSIGDTGAAARSHVIIYQSNRISVVDNYFYKTDSSASVNYGVESFPASDALIQNNIFEQIQAPVPLNGNCNGCVIAHNFSINDVFINNFANPAFFQHATDVDFTLWEDNFGMGMALDKFHGSHNIFTIFRNYFNGFEKNQGVATTGTPPILLNSFSRFGNLIGNVLGNAANKTIYKTAANAVVAGTPTLSLGFGNDANISDDNNTPLTAMLWGTYPLCSGASPCNSARFSCTEVPTILTGTQAPFANQCPATNTLPASFHLASRPSWWPSSKNFPATGPDVTGGDIKFCVGGAFDKTYVSNSSQCPGGTATTLAGGRITSNPATDCYLNVMNGPPDGTGAALTYNADACYSASSSSPGIAVSPLAGFGTQKIGTPATPQNIIVTSNGTADLTLASIVLGGTNPGDFSISDDCPVIAMPPGSFCTITVGATPTATGSRSGTITVTSNAPTSPTVVPITVTGTAPAASITSALNFGSVTTSTTSPSQPITFTNIGDAVMVISGISITGTDSAMYHQTNDCPGTLNAGSFCTITTTFGPTSTGAKTAFVSVADDASGSPHTSSLTGTGIPPVGPGTTNISVTGGVTLKGGTVIK